MPLSAQPALSEGTELTVPAQEMPINSSLYLAVYRVQKQLRFPGLCPLADTLFAILSELPTINELAPFLRPFVERPWLTAI
jgi:hypothetical protein